MVALAFLLMGAVFTVCVVGLPLLLVYAVSAWWYSRPQRSVAEIRACMACGSDYHASWDPPDFTPAKARRDRSWMSGGLCPNCSGAD